METITRVTSMLGSRFSSRSTGAFVCAAVLFCSVSACAQRDEATNPSSEAPSSSITQSGSFEFIRSTVSFDFSPAASPAAVEENVDLALSGEVTALEPALIQDDVEQIGAVLVSLKPQSVWKADGTATPSQVQFLLRRPTNVGVGQFEAELPVGSQMALLGYTSNLKVVGRPTSAGPVFEPDPQGFLVESQSGGLVNVWGEDESQTDAWERVETLDALDRALR